MDREVLFMKRSYCECGCLEIIRDLENGEYVCGSCGLVLHVGPVLKAPPRRA